MSDTLPTVMASPSRAIEVPPLAIEDLPKAWLLAYTSPRTREAYRDGLLRFAKFLEAHGAGSVLEAKRTHLDAWARQMEADGLKPATIARRLSSLSSFYAFACSEGILQMNPAKNVRRPKVSDESTRLGLTLDTSRKVLTAARDMGPQARAAIALMLLGGLRVSEACLVMPSHVGEELGHRVLTVRGKGGKTRKVVLSPLAMHLIEEALQTAQADGGTILQDERGLPLTRFQAGRLVRGIGRKAALGRPLTPHDLRHGCATSALEAGEPIHLVQAHLGHASPVTTQRYDRNRGKLDNSAAYGLGRALGGA